MGRGIAAAGAAALITCASVSAGHAAVFDRADPVAAEERLLGSADEAAQQKELLTFTRRIGDGGIVTGSLADSMLVAGVPASTSLEALKSLESVIDLDRDIHTGDHFYVRHEETFTAAGDRIGVGRVLWLEVNTRARGTIAIHRFRPRSVNEGRGVDQFWLPSGQAAAPPAFRPPLDVMKLTSGFGLRADPLDHPSSGTMPAVVEVPMPQAAPAPQEVPTSSRELRAVNRAYAGFDMGSLGSAARDAMGGGSDIDRIMARRRIRAQEAAERERQQAEAAAAAAAKAKAAPQVEASIGPPKVQKLFMHEGLDLFANIGTPIHAAADGVVLNLGPAGGYGNWVRLGHAGKITTVYGHLSRVAPGLQVGEPVLRGELIGFVGNTGRSTGAHLHYEIQSNGRPVDPATWPATRQAHLAAGDLALFRKRISASLAECALEGRHAGR
ncbi:MAG: M23 family metallopeptidase [Proteobacteria bacterium]|nr:M23 family metallopeptidase [Pseudomonadota bacterium]